MKNKHIELFRVSKRSDGCFNIETSPAFSDLSISQIEFLFYHLFNFSSASIIDGSSIELFKHSDVFSKSLSDSLKDWNATL